MSARNSLKNKAIRRAERVARKAAFALTYTYGKFDRKR